MNKFLMKKTTFILILTCCNVMFSAHPNNVGMQTLNSAGALISSVVFAATTLGVAKQIGEEIFKLSGYDVKYEYDSFVQLDLVLAGLQSFVLPASVFRGDCLHERFFKTTAALTVLEVVRKVGLKKLQGHLAKRARNRTVQS
jgi:hypothetical protein